MTRLTPTEPTPRVRLLSDEMIASLVQMNARRPGMLHRLVEVFRECVRDCSDGLREALAIGADDRVRDLTHRLSGASSQMGAHALAEACRALAAAQRDQVPERMHELEALAARSLSDLEALATHSASA